LEVTLRFLFLEGGIASSMSVGICSDEESFSNLRFDAVLFANCEREDRVVRRVEGERDVALTNLVVSCEIFEVRILVCGTLVYSCWLQESQSLNCFEVTLESVALSYPKLSPWIELRLGPCIPPLR